MLQRQIAPVKFCGFTEFLTLLLIPSPHSVIISYPVRFDRQDLPSRPRRNRRSTAFRQAISETHISPANLILPVFVHDGEQNIPIASMPGVDRLGWRHGLIENVAEARSLGVNQVVIFPKVSEWLAQDAELGCG
jgi:hypothetical protein